MSGNALTIHQMQPGQLCLLLAARRRAAEIFGQLTAQLALHGRVRLLDGGNSLDVYRLARSLRAETADLERALGRITTARAFTCYQMTALLARQTTTPQPLLVLNLLDTFGDENIRLGERQRLLRGLMRHLQRLSAHAPLAVSADPAQPFTAQLLPLAEHIFAPAQPLPPPSPARLF